MRRRSLNCCHAQRRYSDALVAVPGCTGRASQGASTRAPYRAWELWGTRRRSRRAHRATNRDPECRPRLPARTLTGLPRPECPGSALTGSEWLLGGDDTTRTTAKCASSIAPEAPKEIVAVGSRATTIVQARDQTARSHPQGVGRALAIMAGEPRLRHDNVGARVRTARCQPGRRGHRHLTTLARLLLQRSPMPQWEHGATPCQQRP